MVATPKEIAVKILAAADGDEHTAATLLIAARTDGYLYVNMLRRIFSLTDRYIFRYTFHKMHRHGIIEEVEKEELKKARMDPKTTFSKLERSLVRCNLVVGRHQLEKIRWYRLTEGAKEAVYRMQRELMKILSPDVASRCAEYRKALAWSLAMESERVRERLREIYRESMRKLFEFSLSAWQEEELDQRIEEEAEKLRRLGMRVSPESLRKEVEVMKTMWKSYQTMRGIRARYREFLEKVLPKSFPGEKKTIVRLRP